MQSLLPAARLLLITGVALLGAWAATTLHTPLPWMLGPLIGCAAVSMLRLRVLGEVPVMPTRLRDVFVPIIGLMIGSRVTPDTIEAIGRRWPSLLLVPPFALATQMISYTILRRLVQYDKATAFFGSTPGGVAEAAVISERYDGDPAKTVVQHLARISLTVTLIPLVLSLYIGHTVGSAAGDPAGSAAASIGLRDIVLLGLSAIAGAFVAKRLRLPAANIIGPMIASAALHVSGMTYAEIPAWLIHVTQLVIGASLAGRFAAVDLITLSKGALISIPLLAVSLSMAALAGLVVALMDYNTGIVGFISFAPGGVTEMNLIAVSIHADTVFVACHHVVRILTATLLFPMFFRFVVAQR